MLRSGGPDRRGRTLRALGAWIGLSYAFASAAGAAGAGGCVHADLGHDEGHSAHASVDAESTLAHHAPVPLPCAAGEDVAVADVPSNHSAPAPCDCLGDCSVSTGPADLSAGSSMSLAGSTEATADRSNPGSVEAFPVQYRLPYPNAPPLL